MTNIESALLSVLIGALFSMQNCMADIREETNIGGHDIFISGEISKGDASQLKKALNRPHARNSFPPQIILESRGGDVAEALAMGDIIYKADFGTEELISGKKVQVRKPPFVFVNNRVGCASACVLIYASVILRSSDSPVLVVHNPYLSDKGLAYESVKELKDSIASRAKLQFKRVGVSESLWDMIEHTPSYEQKKLSDDDMERLGLIGADPSFTDYEDGIDALRYGLSKGEYIRRKGLLYRCFHKQDIYSLSVERQFLVGDQCREEAGLSFGSRR